jgi:hypothetical protein
MIARFEGEASVLNTLQDSGYSESKDWATQYQNFKSEAFSLWLIGFNQTFPETFDFFSEKTFLCFYEIDKEIVNKRSS